MYICDVFDKGNKKGSKRKIKTVLRTKVEARNVERNAGRKTEESIYYVLLERHYQLKPCTDLWFSFLCF